MEQKTAIYPNTTEDWDQVFANAKSLAELTKGTVAFTFCDLELEVTEETKYGDFCTTVRELQKNLA